MVMLVFVLVRVADPTRLIYRYGSKGTIYEIQVENPSGKAGRISEVELDGQPLSASDKEVGIVLVEDGGRHEVRVELG